MGRKREKTQGKGRTWDGMGWKLIRVEKSKVGKRHEGRRIVRESKIKNKDKGEGVIGGGEGG